MWHVMQSLWLHGGSGSESCCPDTVMRLESKFLATLNHKRLMSLTWCVFKLNKQFLVFIFNYLNFYWFIWEREWLICCSTYLCICWLILACALTGDQTCNLGVLRWHSNKLGYPARAFIIILIQRNNCFQTISLSHIFFPRITGEKKSVSCELLY